MNDTKKRSCIYCDTKAFDMPPDNTDPMSGPLTLFIQVEHLIHISPIGIAWYGTGHLVIYGSHVERV